MACLIRVFPRRTKATPVDDLVRFGFPDLFAPMEADECHVSCAFTWDLPRAEQLAEAWSRYIPTQLGGPGTGSSRGEFVPGRYLREGYTITSRGCPNSCWFCRVPSLSGAVTELPIADGWNVLDDNLLACSESHVRAVFSMLQRQPEPIQFTGGLEAARLFHWHADLLAGLRLGQLFLAYDGEEDYEPLRDAVWLLREAGIDANGRSHVIRCYVLIGFPQDRFESAEGRLKDVLSLGIMPMAMLYRGDTTGERDPAWVTFQRQWARPAFVANRLRDGTACG